MQTGSKLGWIGIRRIVITGGWQKSLLLSVCLILMTGCGGPRQPEVVVYTALDRVFSEPILNEFEAQTGIKALVKYDSEATKTVGLVNAIRAEKNRPRCDVFWNNEIVNTIRLKNEGLLENYKPEAAQDYPANFRDPDGAWSGFAARARVLIVNTNLVPAVDDPDSIHSLADPKWKGRIGIAKPLFGTTATHVACLFSFLGQDKAKAFLQTLKANEVRVLSGNKTVALDVSAGRLAFGLTDTDDAISEVESGKPVKIVYPDARADQLGVLFIPNTLALIKNAPHPEEAKKLIEYLLSPDVEAKLARSKSAQIPLHTLVRELPRVKTPAQVKTMPANFADAARIFEQAAAYIEDTFLN